MKPEPSLVARFAADLDALVAPGGRVGVAVSGGPDSVALLLLAAAARPGSVEAATVDHRLRPESSAEAAMVARLCAELGVAHRTLPIDWSERPSTHVQARARHERYRLLAEWAAGRGLVAVATAHHADDQAETLLMRLARGHGVGGLAGARASRALTDGVALVRPLLGWRKDQLEALCAEAGVAAVDDPSNRDPAYERSRVRAALAGLDLDSAALANSAAALADADEALAWTADRLAGERVSIDGNRASLDPSGLPPELVRRLLLTAFRALGAPEPRGPDLARAAAALGAGRPASLSGLLLKPGAGNWTIAPEPPRNH